MTEHEQRQLDIKSGEELDRRERMRAKLAEREAERGRPLTPAEKLNNLEDGLGMERGALRRGVEEVRKLQADYYGGLVVPTDDDMTYDHDNAPTDPHHGGKLTADMIVAREREKVAQWMTANGFATGHGDTIDDLLNELSWQVRECVLAEREGCACEVEEYLDYLGHASPNVAKALAAAIRARGNSP